MFKFRSVVSAIVYSFLHELPAQEVEPEVFLNNRVVDFVLERHCQMPDFFRWPIFVMTVVLDALTISTDGRAFHRLTHEQRWRHILSWRNSRIRVLRDLVRFYESLAIYGWYALVEEQLETRRDRNAPS